MSTISVIIPVYNVEQYLSQCLESIINQTFQDLEIMIIDDGSTDNSGKIADEFAQKDNRIKVIHQENKGYAKTVNNGIKSASGEYISIIESDDFCELKMFECLQKRIEETNCDFVKCNFSYFWQNTEQDIPATVKLHNKYYKKPFTLKDCPEILKLHPSVWAAIYKKDFLINNNIFFTESENGAYLDILFTFKAFICAKNTAFINSPLYHYRQDNPNSTVNNPKKIYCISDEYDLLTKYLDERPDIKLYVNKYKLLKQYRDYKWNLQRLSPEYKDEFVEKFVLTFESLSKNNNLKKELPQKEYKELCLLKENKKLYIEKYGQEFIDKNKKILRLHINKQGLYLSIFGHKIIDKKFNKQS